MQLRPTKDFDIKFGPVGEALLKALRIENRSAELHPWIY
jgi:hypothetical protein